MEKKMPIVFGLIILMLTIECGFMIYEYANYEERKDYGNARWAQVDDIITDLEERIKSIEESCNCG